MLKLIKNKKQQLFVKKHRFDPIVDQFSLVLDSYIISNKLDSKYNAFVLSSLQKLLVQYPLFHTDSQIQSSNQEIVSQLLWTYPYECAQVMNSGQWNFDIKDICNYLLAEIPKVIAQGTKENPMYRKSLTVDIYNIIKFIGQFSQVDDIYNACCETVKKLHGIDLAPLISTEYVSYLFTYNRYFKSSFTSRNKPPEMNRLFYFRREVYPPNLYNGVVDVSLTMEYLRIVYHAMDMADNDIVPFILCLHILYNKSIIHPQTINQLVHSINHGYDIKNKHKMTLTDIAIKINMHTILCNINPTSSGLDFGDSPISKTHVNPTRSDLDFGDSLISKTQVNPTRSDLEVERIISLLDKNDDNDAEIKFLVHHICQNVPDSICNSNNDFIFYNVNVFKILVDKYIEPKTDLAKYAIECIITNSVLWMLEYLGDYGFNPYDMFEYEQLLEIANQPFTNEKIKNIGDLIHKRQNIIYYLISKQ